MRFIKGFIRVKKSYETVAVVVMKEVVMMMIMI